MASKTKSAKPTAPPNAIKNTYFWIAAILVVVGVVGLVRGGAAIRDPGQRPESSLALLYFGGAVVMAVNGWMSHRLTVQAYEEEKIS